MAVFLMCVDPMEQDTVSTPPRRAAVQKWKGWWLLIEGLFLLLPLVAWCILRNERIAFVPYVGRGLLLPHMNICVLLDLGKNTFFLESTLQIGSCRSVVV